MAEIFSRSFWLVDWQSQQQPEMLSSPRVQVAKATTRRLRHITKTDKLPLVSLYFCLRHTFHLLTRHLSSETEAKHVTTKTVGGRGRVEEDGTEFFFKRENKRERNGCSVRELKSQRRRRDDVNTLRDHLPSGWQYLRPRAIFHVYPHPH